MSKTPSIQRLLKLVKNKSFFIFGARGTGKSSLLEISFNKENCLWINLLDPQTEEQFAHSPQELIHLVNALPAKVKYVVIDEVQKLPKLLDAVHLLIESTHKYFILTGSSARKLKHGGANLLAGRAFIYHLFPFSCLELKEKFDLKDALQFGLLPRIYHLKTATEKQQFLHAYCHTYLKEEIWAEQIIRKLDPFRRFLEVAAQMNGKIINYNNISRDVGVDDKTIKDYFSILEDTLIGFFLEPFIHSFRKRLSQKAKFYFFDVGVARALARLTSLPIEKKTSYYGEIFEQFIIVECWKLCRYFKPEYRLSYLKTKDDAEVDLVVERPGQALLLIEIKSDTFVKAEQLRSLEKIRQDLPQAEAVCFSQDSRAKKIADIMVLPWQQGLKKYFS